MSVSLFTRLWFFVCICNSGIGTGIFTHQTRIFLERCCGGWTCRTQICILAQLTYCCLDSLVFLEGYWYFYPLLVRLLSPTPPRNDWYFCLIFVGLPYCPSFFGFVLIWSAMIVENACMKKAFWIHSWAGKMALPKSPKRKINGENCGFNDERTDKYVFIMPTFLDVKLSPSQIKQQLSSPVTEKLPHWNLGIPVPAELLTTF